MKVVLIGAFVYVAIVAFLARKKLRELHPKRFFLDTWREVDARRDLANALDAPPSGDSSEAGVAHFRSPGVEHAPAAPRPYDWKPLTAYVTLAVILVLQEYFGDRGTFNKLRDIGWTIDYGGDPATGLHQKHIFITHAWHWLASERWGDLYALGYWVVTRVGGYTILPILLILIWRQRIRDYGLSLKGFLEHAWIYALFFGIVLIAVILVSQTRDFATYYPFYAQANRSWRDFFYWEVMYASQFFALEFFFRGFLLFSSEKRLGSGVILAMVVPYCMIHFGKPVLETFAAIFAGIVLGTLALKTRSIWSGFLIHVTVALSMDMAALLQKGGLPGGIHLPASWNF